MDDYKYETKGTLIYVIWFWKIIISIYISIENRFQFGIVIQKMKDGG